MFGKKLGLIIVILAAVLASSSVYTNAQTPASPTTLRDLAAKLKFHVGAAVAARKLSDPAYADTVSQQFNILTPENEAKFCSIENPQGMFDFRPFDTIVDFAQKNNIVIRGHNLVWHECLPAWVTSSNFTQQEAIQALRDHIYTEVGRYKGRVAMWDVVNEAMSDGGSGLRVTPWRTLIGDNYIELAFRFAHEADPDALLFYNDYNGEGLTAKSDAIYAMVKGLVADGVPINGVGIQMHISINDVAPGKRDDPQDIAKNMERLGALGLQVQVTEMDVKFDGKPTDDILKQQAVDYRQIMQTCLDSKFCTAFVVWGVSDKDSWLRQAQRSNNPDVAPLLFDEKYQPKPAYFALQDLLASRTGS